MKKPVNILRVIDERIALLLDQGALLDEQLVLGLQRLRLRGDDLLSGVHRAGGVAELLGQALRLLPPFAAMIAATHRQL